MAPPGLSHSQRYRRESLGERSARLHRSRRRKHLQNFWTEPTGTDVSLIVNLGDKLFHGTIFFPRWVMNNPEKTVCFQNDHIPLMVSYREAGPAYPTEVIDEFATITFVRDCGADNDEVINCPANELPDNFPGNL